jgi:hypothetical protein
VRGDRKCFADSFWRSYSAADPKKTCHATSGRDESRIQSVLGDRLGPRTEGIEASCVLNCLLDREVWRETPQHVRGLTVSKHEGNLLIKRCPSGGPCRVVPLRRSSARGTREVRALRASAKKMQTFPAQMRSASANSRVDTAKTSYPALTCILPASYLPFTCILPVSYLHLTWTLPGYCLDATW